GYLLLSHGCVAVEDQPGGLVHAKGSVFPQRSHLPVETGGARGRMLMLGGKLEGITSATRTPGDFPNLVFACWVTQEKVRRLGVPLSTDGRAAGPCPRGGRGSSARMSRL